MAIALVQQVGIAGANLTSPQTLTLGAASTAGNTLMVVGHFFDGASGSCFPTSVTDSAGNTWNVSTSNAQTPPTQQNSSGANVETEFVAWSVNAASVTTVTVARQDTGSNWWRIAVSEWSGIYQFDNSWAGSQASGTTFTLGPVTLNNSGELVVAACADNSGTLTIPGGWTEFTTAGGGVTGWDLPGTTGSYTPQWSSTVSDFWAAAVAVFSPVPLASTGPGPQQRRLYGPRYRRRYTPVPAVQVTAAAAAPAAPQVLPPRRVSQALGRARLGRAAAAAAGILATTTLSPQPASVPPARPQPSIGHPAPHRAIVRGILPAPPRAFLTAKLPPTAISPRPPHRATGKGVLAKTTLSPQPSSVPPPQWRQPFAPRPAHRAIWRAAAGPAPAVVTVTAVPPARPQPVTNRPPAPHRATGKGILAPTTLSPQPSRVPPPQWRQPFAPRPPHRAVWRAVSGPAPAVIGPAPAAPSRPAPVTNRPPPPHRAVTRWVLAKTTLSAQPSRVPGPQWRQPFAPRPAHRATWRRIAGAAPPPPPFTIGTLTTADTPVTAFTSMTAGT